MAYPNSAQTDCLSPDLNPRINLSGDEQSIVECKAIICKAWPKLFPGGRLRPLQLGIFNDMLNSAKATNLGVTKLELKFMIYVLKSSFEYCVSIATPKSTRWDLEGNPVEIVTLRRRAQAVREVRAVGKQRSLKLKTIVNKYACLLNRPSAVIENNWMNECDEQSRLYILVTHGRQWGMPTLMRFDFRRQLLKCPLEEREPLARQMWEMLPEIVPLIKLYHGIEISLAREEYSGTFDGLNELATYTVIECLYRRFATLFSLHDPNLMYNDAGITPPTPSWRRKLVFDKRKKPKQKN